MHDIDIELSSVQYTLFQTCRDVRDRLRSSPVRRRNARLKCDAQNALVERGLMKATGSSLRQVHRSQLSERQQGHVREGVHDVEGLLLGTPV